LVSSLPWPTFFMGVSLPLLAKALTPNVRVAAPMIGALYGTNTLGAAAGALVTSWILVPRFGLEESLKVGVALNLACAIGLVLLLILIRDQPTGNALTREPPEQEANPPLLASEPTGFT